MTQRDPNEITIDTYDAHVRDYLEYTPATYSSQHIPLIKWIDQILTYVKPDGHILEIGSATPRDAQYIRSKGFAVQCSDAAHNFVKHLQEVGEPALLINATRDKIEGPYDGIFANAVFPHFTVEDTIHALKNIHQALSKDGIVAFNVKQGEGSEWVDEKSVGRRYIHYWQPYEIHELVSSCGFSIVAIEDGIGGDLPTHVWTRIIAQKL